MLALSAHRQELEEAEQVRVPRPLPISSWPQSQREPRKLFLLLPSSFLPPPFSLPKVGARLGKMEWHIQESRTSLEKDIKALSELLARLGEESPRLGPDP